jgi:hypothetical protein
VRHIFSRSASVSLRFVPCFFIDSHFHGRWCAEERFALRGDMG